MLSINSRHSVIFRSAYLRALHCFIDRCAIDPHLAKSHARHIGVMADPHFWAVDSTSKPDWWPEDPGDRGGIEMLPEAVGSAIRQRFIDLDPKGEDILVYASGPVSNRPSFRADVHIRAFLQSAHGATKPDPADFKDMPWFDCELVPPRLGLPGSYESRRRHKMYGDWLVAPLSWRVMGDTELWLMPDRLSRGIHLPPTWLFSAIPQIVVDTDGINIQAEGHNVARWRYWNDEVRERLYRNVESRVGAELTLRKECVEHHLASGASLAWYIQCWASQRGEYKSEFDEPLLIGSWLVGGSRIVRPEPWVPSSL